MSIKKILACTLATTAAFATLSFSGCNKDDGKTLYVYTNAGFAPYEYVSNGKVVGVDIDGHIRQRQTAGNAQKERDDQQSQERMELQLGDR